MNKCTRQVQRTGKAWLVSLRNKNNSQTLFIKPHALLKTYSELCVTLCKYTKQWLQERLLCIRMYQCNAMNSLVLTVSVDVLCLVGDKIKIDWLANSIAWWLRFGRMSGCDSNTTWQSDKSTPFSSVTVDNMSLR